MNNRAIPLFPWVIIFLLPSLLLFGCSKHKSINSTGDKPSPPKNVEVVSGGGEVTISWEPVEGAESYNLYWADRLNVTQDANKIENVESPYRHTGLVYDSTYFYRITAVNESGESAFSDEVNAVPHRRVAIPDVPANIQIAAGDKKIMISWDTVSEDVRYNIYWSETSGVTQKSTKIPDVSTPFIHDDLSNGTMYYYCVSAENETGESDLSATKYAVPGPATKVPNPPNNVKIYERNSILTFTWDPVIDASLYNVYWSFGSTVSRADNKEITTTTPFDLINMENNKNVYIRISSRNDVGEGQLSVTYSAVPMPLAPPQNLLVTESYKQVTLLWKTVPNAAFCNLYWRLSDDTNFIRIADVTSPFVHDSLDPSMIYVYYLTSANPFEESKPSVVVSASTKLTPPFAVDAKGGYRENRLTWTSVSHVPAYLVYWRTGSGADTTSGTAVCSTSSFVHENLPLNTHYYYRIRSKDGDALSERYSEAWAKTLLDMPEAKAGDDLQVTKGDTVHLHGVGIDSFGTIVKYEWKIGDQEWVETSSGDTVIIAPEETQSIICSLKVTDDDGLVDSDDIKIVIALDPPNVSLKASRTTAGFNDTVALTIEASDSGRIVSYEMKFGADDWISVSGNDTTVRTPSVAGAWACSLKVTDDDGEYALGRVSITVKSNPPKVTVQGSPLTTGLNDQVTFSCEATDDGSVIGYKWKFGGGDWIETSTGDTVVRTPSIAGTWVCSLLVTDDDGEITRKVVNVKVESHPPKVTAVSDVQTTGFNDPVAFTGNATDNGTVALYEWKFGTDDWVAVTEGDTTAKSPFNSGEWMCILRATDDDGETACDTVKISVVSHPPVVTASSNVGTTGFNDPVEFSGTASDNETGLHYFWKFGSEDWVESQVITVTRNAPFTAGTWVCSLKVTDADGETGYAQVAVGVESSPPTVAAAGTPLSTGLNDPVTLSVTATDDGAIVKYEWKLGGSDWLTASGNDTIVYTPSVPGTWVCSLRVTDDDGEQRSDKVSITVVSNPPVVQATAAPGTTGLNDPVVFTADATDNGSVEKYEWKFGNGNWIEVSSGDTTVNAPFMAGAWACSLKVTDDDGETTIKNFQITVTSNPPTAQASSNPSTSVGLNESIDFSGSGTDNDGSIVSYEWKFGNSNWIRVGSGDTTITAPATAQVLVCSLKVVDDDNEIGYDELSLYVDPQTVTDIDGNTYSTVRIGDQLWTTANLRTSRYNDGGTIAHITDNTAWGTAADGAYCFYGNTTVQADREKFGALYNCSAITTGKLAPAGWHVPTESECDQLRDYLRLNGYNFDGSTTQYLMGKAVASTTDWDVASYEGRVGYHPETNNSTGLNLYPAAYRDSIGVFDEIHAKALMASRPESAGASWACYYLWAQDVAFNKASSLAKRTGISVRLVMD